MVSKAAREHARAMVAARALGAANRQKEEQEAAEKSRVGETTQKKTFKVAMNRAETAAAIKSQLKKERDEKEANKKQRSEAAAAATAAVEEEARQKRREKHEKKKKKKKSTHPEMIAQLFHGVDCSDEEIPETNEGGSEFTKNFPLIKEGLAEEVRAKARKAKHPKKRDAEKKERAQDHEAKVKQKSEKKAIKAVRSNAEGEIDIFGQEKVFGLTPPRIIKDLTLALEPVLEEDNDEYPPMVEARPQSTKSEKKRQKKQLRQEGRVKKKSENFIGRPKSTQNLAQLLRKKRGGKYAGPKFAALFDLAEMLLVVEALPGATIEQKANKVWKDIKGMDTGTPDSLLELDAVPNPKLIDFPEESTKDTKRKEKLERQLQRRLERQVREEEVKLNEELSKFLEQAEQLEEEPEVLPTVSPEREGANHGENREQPTPRKPYMYRFNSTIAAASDGSVTCLWGTCRTRFTTLKALYFHVRERHIESGNRKQGHHTGADFDHNCYWGNCEHDTSNLRRRSHIMAHIAAHHIPFLEYTCKFCDREFNQPHHVLWHIKRHHPDESEMLIKAGTMNEFVKDCQCDYSDVVAHEEKSNKRKYSEALLANIGVPVEKPQKKMKFTSKKKFKAATGMTHRVGMFRQGG